MDPKETAMQSFDVFLDTTREFLHQAAAFMPRVALALLIVAFGWLIAKAVRLGVERGLRAVNFNVLTDRAVRIIFCNTAVCVAIRPLCSGCSRSGSSSLLR